MSKNLGLKQIVRKVLKEELQNMDDINKILDKVNNYGLKSLNMDELDLWNKQVKPEDYKKATSNVSDFFIKLFMDLGVIKNANMVYSMDPKTFVISEFGNELDEYFFDSEGQITVNIEKFSRHERETEYIVLSDKLRRQINPPQTRPKEDPKTWHILFISFEDDGYEFPETEKLRQKVIEFIGEKLKSAGVFYDFVD
jgi:hypothetical protein